jgi:nucleotide-binding universal stress UspA family protein
MCALIDNGDIAAWPVAPPFPQRVLNAVSGSRASAHATATAAAIASERNAELILVHVLAPAAVRVSRFGPTVIRTRRLDDPFSSPVLLAARRVAWSHGALARIVLFDGETVPAILNAARDMEAGLIVIGQVHSRARISRARTGPRLRRRSVCPVLAVPAHSRLVPASGRLLTA